MQVRRFGFLRGAQWLLEGFRLYRVNPFSLAANLMLMWLALMFAGLLLMPVATLILPAAVAPWIGQLPLALLLPALSVGMLNACEDLRQGRPLSPVRVFSGLQRNAPRLFALGAIYYVGTLVALALTSAMDGGMLLAAMRDSSKLASEDVDSAAMLQSMLTLVVLSLPAMAANWFAPALTGWRGVPPVKAAFFSIVACWRNVAAFLGYALTVLGCFWLLPSLLGGIVARGAPQLGVSLILLLPMLMAPALYGSFYATTRDVLPELFDGEAA
ncbi:BPSS1780 family membrane protein [Niveibacterium sp. SC-1]|uniref:BPSS1780 family membrane protein n=1 Tax=Niveibacterium sp. SC-1 TaxID=3135646 RepID=UPI00311D5368